MSDIINGMMNSDV